MIRRRLKPTGPRIDYDAVTQFGGIPKSRPMMLDKHAKESSYDTQMRKAYAAVDVRDFDTCRVTGARLFPSTADDRRRREHNHLRARSLAKSLRTAVKNIFLVSAYVHQFITSNALIVHGRDADKPLTFSWNRRLVPAGKEPFRIQPSARYEPGRKAAA